MRTTLTLDADVAALLRGEAERSRRPFKQVVNQAIRLGLSSRGESERKPFRTQPHAFDVRPGFDLDKASQLLDPPDVEDFTRKHARDMPAGVTQNAAASASGSIGRCNISEVSRASIPPTPMP